MQTLISLITVPEGKQMVDTLLSGKVHNYPHNVKRRNNLMLLH